MVMKSKRLGGAGNQGVDDRFSSLRDSVLCHILSCLILSCAIFLRIYPQKYAVATAILASRWKLVCSALPSLCFDDSLCFKSGAFTNVALAGIEKFFTRCFVELTRHMLASLLSIVLN